MEAMTMTTRTKAKEMRMIVGSMRLATDSDRQIALEVVLGEVTKHITTWNSEACAWFTEIERKARKNYDEFITAPPEASVKIEAAISMACLLQESREPDRGADACEILDVLPPWLKKIEVAGIHTAVDVIWFILKVLLPSEEFCRIGVA
eukprot:4833405-Amphidinium_carterae.1